MLPQISCNDAKIVCIWQSYYPFLFCFSHDAIEGVSEIVPNALLAVNELDDGVKGEDEDDGAHWITLKNPTFESENVRVECWCYHF